MKCWSRTKDKYNFKKPFMGWWLPKNRSSAIVLITWGWKLIANRCCWATGCQHKHWRTEEDEYAEGEHAGDFHEEGSQRRKTCHCGNPIIRSKKKKKRKEFYYSLYLLKDVLIKCSLRDLAVLFSFHQLVN